MYPRAKIGHRPMVMSTKKEGYLLTDRHTKGCCSFIVDILYFISVRQLHREFLRAGADVMQAFTFYASDDKLENRGNTAQQRYSVGNVLSLCPMGRSNG